MALLKKTKPPCLFVASHHMARGVCVCKNSRGSGTSGSEAYLYAFFWPVGQLRVLWSAGSVGVLGVPVPRPSHQPGGGANDAEWEFADRTSGSGGGSGVGGGALYEITKANTCAVTSACW